MKVKHTKNGNVKITLTMEHAGKLLTILSFSGDIKAARNTDQSHEDVSWDVWRALRDAGVDLS